MKARALGHRAGGIPARVAASKVIGVARPKRLYHYTSTVHLPAILEAGYLKLTESNIEMSGAGPGVVWFTDRPDAVGIGVTPGFKDAVEIVIETPPDAEWWPHWSMDQGMDDFWYEALASAAGGSPDRWWVVPRRVPISEWVSVKVHGKPLGGFHFGQAAIKSAAAEVSTEALQKAAESAGYFSNTFAGVSYRATGESPTYECKPHDWLPEYVIEDQAERIVGRAKTARGALSLMVRKADAVARIGAFKTAEADTKGVMVCLVPEKEASKTLMDASGSTEALDEQHITLLYLGSTEDAGGDAGRERLHRAVYDFAIHSGHDVLNGKANGWGVFNNLEEDEAVLIALWDIPGISEFRTALQQSCVTHGVTMREDNHGFTPHSTMKYLDESTTTIPAAVDPAPVSVFSHVVISWGDDWQSVALPGSLAKTADREEFDSDEHPRGGNAKNKGEFSKAPGSGSPSPTKTTPAPAKDAPKQTPKADAPKKSDAPKKPRDPKITKAMIARGDVYGEYLPKGKYQEGDPRNDPEFEKKHDRISKLSTEYTKPDFVKDKEGKPQRVKSAWDSPTGGQTQDLYDNQEDPETGAMDWYEPKRHKMQEKILDEMEARAKDVPHEGKCIIMAGPSGAGKSTFLKNYGAELGIEGGKAPTNYVVINPDDFKELIPYDDSRYPGLDDNEMASVRHEESSYLAQRAANRLMAMGVNVIMDITMSDAAKAEKKYVKGKSDKYTYTVVLVDGDMKNSLNNAGNRWKEPDEDTGERGWGGRWVPMSLPEMQAPTEKGYRSVNAQEFVKFVAKPFVAHAFVYDP